jgi:hypothetical protein
VGALRPVVILQRLSAMRANRGLVLGLGTSLLALLAACGGGNLGSAGAGGSGTGGITTGSGGGGGDSWGGTGGAGAVGGYPNGRPLVTGLANAPWDIAVDATHVYWLDQIAQTIMKVPKQGGTPVALASGVTVNSLAVDANFVYWTNSVSSGTVMKVAIAGGAPTPVATGQLFPAGIAVDATNLYWVNAGSPTLGAGSVMKASLATGVSITLAANQETALAIAIDATSVYWTKGPFDTGGGEVMTVPIAGGTPVRLAQVPSSDAEVISKIGTSLAVDGESVYFADGTGPIDAGVQNWTIKKIPHAGGAEELKASSRLIADVAVDGSILTWATDRAIVRRYANTTEYYETDGQPRAIAADQTHIYFTTVEGAVMAMAKL